MIKYRQGDVIKINGFKYKFLIVSNNAYIDACGCFHVVPLFENLPEGPVHIKIATKINHSVFTAVCEQIKFIDPSARRCSAWDSISYDQLMNISDAIQGIFEYD